MNDKTAEIVKTYRATLGGTLDDVARLCGTTRQNVHSWETGKTSPSVGAIQVMQASADRGVVELGNAIARALYGHLLNAIKES